MPDLIIILAVALIVALVLRALGEIVIESGYHGPLSRR